MNTFFSFIINGLLALLPIIILLWLLKLVYSTASNIIYDIFASTEGSVLATTVILISVIIFLFALGYIVEKNKEAIFLKVAELAIGKIPIISSIYSTLKEVVNLFSGKGSDNYLGVVWIKIGDVRVMGFVTKEVEDTYFVFVPTTPNPTSGFLINVKKDNVEKSDLSVANGFKKLVSLGIK